MIVRTYGRRSRCISRSYSDSDFNGDGDGDGDGEGEDTTTFRGSNSQEIYNNVGFSSQDSSSSSSPWAFDSAAELYGSNNSSQGSLSQGDGGGVRKSKKSSSRRRTLLNRELKESNNVNNNKSSISRGGVGVGVGVGSTTTTTTSTLMEAQEFGEMMEHVDEVNFALDGLRKGQPSRIRRASLLSLLSICSTATQRRLLRTHGMAKTIIDAILALSFDDSPSTLAAAALFYILSSDGQDEHLLDSPICVRFLLRLLSPSMPVSADDKAPTIGCKLLALRRDPGILRDQTNRLDASSTAIISKVQDILLSSKEIEASSRDDDGVGRPELSSKWIALLTMEKACLSTVSLEDTSDMVRRVGGNFKEKLRELGGLDAVFGVARDCHSVMERWSEKSLSSFRELKDDVVLQTIILLLKCLKIMENATFLSKDNQNHLLGMTGKSGCEDSSLSFTNLMISVIKILSGLSLVRGSSTSSDGRSHFVSNGKSHTSKISLKEDDRVDRNGDLSSSSSGRCYSMETVSDINNLKTSKKRPRLSTSQSVYSVSSSETTSASTANVFSVKSFKSSTSGSCIGISRSSSVGVAININNLKMNAGLSKRPSVTENIEDISLDDSQDPFAFDADEFAPSKWDMLARKKEVPRTKKNRVMFRDFDGGCEPPKITSHLESIKEEDCHVIEITDSDSPPVEEENPRLLSDCLLTAVKVLMNLTNDNPVGCQQIAAGGGLETLSNLIVGHFPSFSSCISSCSQTSDATLTTPQCSPELVHQTDRHLTDQELDFLVAILGLLVNLVEKDSRNRSRLAAASVSLPMSGGSEETHCRRDVIPLLCSIFLANQGAGEAAEDGRLLPWNDEAAVLQGEREAEKMIIEAYAALLLAFLSTESKIVREAIACCLPDHNLEVLVPVLERFVAFHLTLNMISPETHSAVSEVIESCRGR